MSFWYSLLGESWLSYSEMRYSMRNALQVFLSCQTKALVAASIETGPSELMISSTTDLELINSKMLFR